MADWDQPIGFGKAGNNPYSMGALGVNALSGGGGLLGLLKQLLTPASEDPQQQLAFLRQADVQGRPVASTARIGGGLIPMALSKIGLMNRNVTADPNTMAMEQQLLEQKKQKGVQDIMGGVQAAYEEAAKAGPEAGKQMWGAMQPYYAEEAGQPYMPQSMASLVSGVDVSKVMSPELIKAQHEADYLRISLERDKINELRAEADRMKAIATQTGADARDKAYSIMLDRDLKARETEQRRQLSGMYAPFLHDLISRRSSNVTGDTKIYDQGLSLLEKSLAQGITPTEAIGSASPEIQALFATADVPGRGPEDAVLSGWGLGSHYGEGTATGAAPTAGAPGSGSGGVAAPPGSRLIRAVPYKGKVKVR
jgi:hypothetical protein